MHTGKEISANSSGSANAASERRKPATLAPGLHVAATPIGNARDVTLRVLDAFAQASMVLCEDTRETGKLLSIHGISARLQSYHEHNAGKMRPRILKELADGGAVLLVSDAGTPLVSDPGYKLVREAIDAGHTVTALPGPSSVLTALCVAGLPTDRFFFAGFLPPKSAARKRELETLATVPGTLVFLEAPQRLADCLADMAEVLGAREAAVTRELTKKFEEVRRAPLAELAAHYAEDGPPRGEVTLVVAPPIETEAGEETLDAALADAMQHESASRAAATVAKALGIPRKRAYARALELAGKTP